MNGTSQLGVRQVVLRLLEMIFHQMRILTVRNYRVDVVTRELLYDSILTMTSDSCVAV